MSNVFIHGLNSSEQIIGLSCDDTGNLNVKSITSSENPLHVEVIGNTYVDNKLMVDIVGQSVNVSNFPNDYATSANIATTNLKLDSVVENIQNKHLSGLTDSIMVSNMIGGYALNTTALATNEALSTLNSTVISKHLNKNLDSIDISGQALNISNFPLSFQVSNFPENQTVSVSNFPNSQTINGSVSVSNFPTTQVISGSVSVSNFATSTEVSNFPASQTINGSVNVSNFPTSTQVSNFPTSTQVSNFPTSTEVSNFPTSQTVNGSVSVSNFPTSFQVSNLPVTQAVSGTIGVSNFPTSFQVSNLPATQAVSGSVNVNTISGFATETTLGNIKTNSDKFKFLGDNVKTQIMNTALDVKVHDGGDNSISSTAVGIDGVRGLDVVIKNATQADPLNVLVDTTAALNCFVSNFPISTDITVNGTPLNQVAGALYTSLRKANGDELGIVGAPILAEITNDFGTETTLASLKANSDKFKFLGDNVKTQIMNTSVVVETGTNPLNVNIASGTLTGADGKAYLYNGAGTTPITSTAVSTKNGIDANIINTSLNVNVSNTVPVSGTFYPATQPVSIASTVPVSIASTVPVSIASTVPVSGAFYQATQPVSIASTVNTQQKTYNITNDMFRDLTSRSVSGAGGILVNAMETYSYLVGLNQSGINLQNTITTAGTTNSLDVQIQNDSTTNFEGVVGLNVYQIYPKKIVYPLNGHSSGAVSGQFIGSGALAYAWTDVLIGLNYVRQFNIYHNGVGTKKIDVEYIDSLGNLATASNLNITTSTTDVVVANALNINRLSWSPISTNPNNTATSVISKDNVLNVYRNSLNSFNCGSSIIMCPNGYVGVISDLYCYTSGGDDFIMIIRDKYNSIKTVRYLPGITPTNNKYYSVGSLNYPLYPGESVFFAGALSTGGSRHVNAIVTLTAI